MHHMKAKHRIQGHGQYTANDLCRVFPTVGVEPRTTSERYELSAASQSTTWRAFVVGWQYRTHWKKSTYLLVAASCGFVTHFVIALCCKCKRRFSLSGSDGVVGSQIYDFSAACSSSSTACIGAAHHLCGVLSTVCVEPSTTSERNDLSAARLYTT